MKKSITVLNLSKADDDNTSISSVISDLQNNMASDMASENITEPDRVYIFVVTEED